MKLVKYILHACSSMDHILWHMSLCSDVCFVYFSYKQIYFIYFLHHYYNEKKNDFKASLFGFFRISENDKMTAGNRIFDFSYKLLFDFYFMFVCYS